MTIINTFLRKAPLACCLCGVLTWTACIDEVEPTTVATESQVAKSPQAQQALVNGLVSTLVDFDTYGTDGGLQDWGYPCQIFYREVLGEDCAVKDPSYDYWGYVENGSYLNATTYYTYYYYYRLIRIANLLINSIQPETANTTQLGYLGQAYTFRAMAYMDLARMFEWKNCGIATLDQKAVNNHVLGLTVPIVTEQTTNEQSRNNPRVSFYIMNRFILSDLKKAENYLSNYARSNKGETDLSVVYGLQARFWLEAATRFEDAPEDLSTQLNHESDADGYSALNIQSAREAYEQALRYARLAQTCGYAPLSQEEWHNPKTGFNDANSNAWMWGAVMNSKEQANLTYYWNSFVASIASETSYGPRYANGFRTITKSLYDQIPDADWRKTSWIDPADAGNETVPAAYKTSLTDSEWKELCEYANLKFRPGEGNTDDYTVGLVADVPMMRIEEMFFIEAEALAHSNGVGAGAAALTSFINTYRYTDGSYQCSATTLNDFTQELMLQKRIEFWGEGIIYFDYKRLKLPITRQYEGSNWPSSFQLNSKPGYVAGWLNYFIPDFEKERNPAIVLNPDPSGIGNM